MLSPIDWKEIHRLVFVDQPNCWKTCGGYCCAHAHERLSFSLIGGEAGMVFFEDEYIWLESQGLLQEGFKERSKLWRIRFGSDLELRFYTSKCSLHGLCTKPDFRPVCCKIYPFVPTVDIGTSQITGYFDGIVFDCFWKLLGLQHPCTLVREREEIVKKQKLSALNVLLSHPYTLFYLNAVGIFMKEVELGLSKFYSANPGLSSQQLSEKWELQYLARRAFDVERTRQSIYESYQIIRQRFPGFSLRVS